jgi:hypothetical protein
MDGTKELPAHLQVRLFKSIAATDFVGRLMSQLQHFPILGGRQACFGDSFSSLFRQRGYVFQWLLNPPGNESGAQGFQLVRAVSLQVYWQRLEHAFQACTTASSSWTALQRLS